MDNAQVGTWCEREIGSATGKMTSAPVKHSRTLRPGRAHGKWLMALALLLALLSNSVSAAAAVTQIYTFDARPLKRLDLAEKGNPERAWDTMHVLAALQGLVNRDAPRLYVFFCAEFGVDTDQFWFDWLTKEDEWLRKAKVQDVSSLPELLKLFRKYYQGLVVYDPAVPATSNLASTAAGCEDLLPIRYDARPDSLFQLLVKELKIPVKRWLLQPDGTSRFTGTGLIPDTEIKSSGSTKIDAYRWALNRYVLTKQCAPNIAAYYLDAFWLQHSRRASPELHTLSNHDYFIARKAFFFDLSPWGDEKPNDDPNQSMGLDREAFLQVMHRLYERSQGGIIKVGGFTPWPYKYTSHASPPGKYDGVPTEWEFGKLISQFNGYMEADAAGLSGMANASFFSHYPLAAHYPQPNPIPKRNSWVAKGHLSANGQLAPKLFVGHYVGDYDAPSWLYKAVPRFFKDPTRGQVPLAWAFDPNLADRAPQALVYAYKNATTNDYFITGDSGAGYLNPRALTVRPDSGLPSGLNAWTAHCREYYRRWDMTITGFILDGAGGKSTEAEFAAYKTFSPHGAGTHFEPKFGVLSGLPTCPERDLPDDPAKATEVILERANEAKGRPSFLWARSILKSPEWYADISRRLREKNAAVEVVDPYTFFGLIEASAQ